MDNENQGGQDKVRRGSGDGKARGFWVPSYVVKCDGAWLPCLGPARPDRMGAVLQGLQSYLPYC